MNAYGVVAEFERRVAEYAGAKYGVATDCCTSAIFLSLKFLQVHTPYDGAVLCPAKTYASVPMHIIHSGYRLRLYDHPWRGRYQLAPLCIFDGAKRFTKGMYTWGLHCLSFHAKKILNIGRGGMVLTDDEEAAKWLRKARYDGRDAKPYEQEQITMLGWHCYMTPDIAARGLLLLDILPEHNEDQTEDYPDLRTFPVFKDYV